jgi:predicted ATP-grasp superfamily ATP-dependent carboligase
LPAGDAAERDLLHYLEGLSLGDVVLVPCSDSWTMRVAELASQMPPRVRTCVAGSDALRTLVEKSRLAETLTTLDLPRPATVLLAGAEALDPLPDDLLERAFLKPVDSQAFFARFGVKGVPVTSRDEARAAVHGYREAGIEVMLQEYVPGPATSHYFLDGFAGPEGDIQALFARQRLRMHPPDFGNSSYMRSIPLEALEPATGALERLLTHLRYRGVFSAEFKRDERDGLFKLLEVNIRPWWYVEFAARCGVDVCAHLYREALGLPGVVAARYRAGVRLVYPYYDWLGCRRAAAGRIRVGGCIWSWFGAQQPLFAWDDPEPAVAEVSEFLGRRVKRLARTGRVA